MRSKEKIFIGVVLFYITCLFFPVITGLLHIPVWFPSILVSVILLAMYPKVVLRNKTFYWLMLYFLIVFLFIIFGRTVKLDIGRSSSYVQLIIEYAFLLPNVIICLILLYLDDYRIVTILMKSTVMIIIVSFVVLLVLIGNVDLRRLSTAYENDIEVQTPSFINYTLLHVYALLIPVVYYCCVKINGLYKYLCIVLLVLLSYVVYKSSITASLIIGVVSLLLSISLSSKNIHRTVFFITVLFATFIVFYYSGVFVSILKGILPYFEGSAVEEKIEDALFLLSTGESGGSFAAREDLHQRSWDSFFSNILIGGGMAGGHSSLIDRLATMGLLGFIPYFMIYYSIIKQWVKHFDRFGKRYYYLGVLSVVVMLYSKGLFGQEGNLVFMVLMPLFIMFPDTFLQRMDSK
ncbi:MAG: Uncharacterized protein AUK63_46 [bacterium P3]|nr:MAG: Uncharacterized protein AUK63_46 [bacterium P3]KWW42491.1 MAG: Uncharacterized protein F083_395 [bacterium F083]